MTETIKLKPCPICGGTPEFRCKTDGKYGYNGHTIMCSNCALVTIFFKRIDDLCRYWNTRPKLKREYIIQMLTDDLLG